MKEELEHVWFGRFRSAVDRRSLFSRPRRAGMAKVRGSLSRLATNTLNMGNESPLSCYSTNNGVSLHVSYSQHFVSNKSRTGYASFGLPSLQKKRHTGINYSILQYLYCYLIQYQYYATELQQQAQVHARDKNLQSLKKTFVLGNKDFFSEGLDAFRFFFEK